uniref:Uncharacterized protein n=1 Tax=viral metagenome TaxID=1070528 RepID=A0A6M3LTI2_9ZZZZ
MRCDTCKDWLRNTEYDHVSEYGKCYALPNDRFEVELRTGWDGGMVDYIETQNDFFCAEYKDKEEQSE